VNQSDDEAERKQAWEVLSEAGLIEIPLDEFVERIRDVKRIVMVRLRELLDFNTGTEERESAAYSLGTLKGLELKLMAHSSEQPDGSKK
jgi:hypothetical protein